MRIFAMSDTPQNDPKPFSPEELETAAAAAAIASSIDPLADAQAELANLKAQNADRADQYLRAQADVQNARRRAGAPRCSFCWAWALPSWPSRTRTFSLLAARLAAAAQVAAAGACRACAT
jgi:hypothetical protein